MTGIALQAAMSAREREAGLIMIEGYVCPAAGVMAVRAGSSKLSVVFIVTGMACETILGRALERSIRVTGTTLQAGVPPG